jgi:hypothetical protein
MKSDGKWNDESCAIAGHNDGAAQGLWDGREISYTCEKLPSKTCTRSPHGPFRVWHNSITHSHHRCFMDTDEPNGCRCMCADMAFDGTESTLAPTHCSTLEGDKTIKTFDTYEDWITGTWTARDGNIAHAVDAYAAHCRPALECPAGWTTYNGKCYKVAGQTNKWVDAKTACESEDAFLVTINDADENDFVINLSDTSCWIGGNDIMNETYTNETGWQWHNGETHGYSNFNQNDRYWAGRIGRDDLPQSHTEDCLMMQGSERGTSIVVGGGSETCTSAGYSSATTSAECQAMAESIGEVFNGNAGGDMAGCMRWHNPGTTSTVGWSFSSSGTDSSVCAGDETKIGYECLCNHGITYNPGTNSYGIPGMWVDTGCGITPGNAGYFGSINYVCEKDQEPAVGSHPIGAICHPSPEAKGTIHVTHRETDHSHHRCFRDTDEPNGCRCMCADMAFDGTESKARFGWIKMLDNAFYNGESVPAPFVPLAHGDFTRIKAVRRSGCVGCSKGGQQRGDGLDQRWQCCSDSNPAFELMKADSYIVQQPNWYTLPSQCTSDGDAGAIICDVSFSIDKDETITPTWFEPSHDVSLHDNHGTVYLDLYAWGEISIAVEDLALHGAALPISKYVQILDNAAYFGNRMAAPIVPMAYGSFSKFVAVYRSGCVGCSHGGQQSDKRWQCCSDSGAAFELMKNSDYIVQSNNWHTLPTECVNIGADDGNIVCNKQFSLTSGDTLTPTWFEPSNGVSLADNHGTVYMDLWALPMPGTAAITAPTISGDATPSWEAHTNTQAMAVLYSSPSSNPGPGCQYDHQQCHWASVELAKTNCDSWGACGALFCTAEHNFGNFVCYARKSGADLEVTAYASTSYTISGDATPTPVDDDNIFNQIDADADGKLTKEGVQGWFTDKQGSDICPLGSGTRRMPTTTDTSVGTSSPAPSEPHFPPRLLTHAGALRSLLRAVFDSNPKQWPACSLSPPERRRGVQHSPPGHWGLLHAQLNDHTTAYTLIHAGVQFVRTPAAWLNK